MYYSAIEKNEMMSFVRKWMGLDTNTLSEIKSHKDEYLMLSHICEIYSKEGQGKEKGTVRDMEASECIKLHHVHVRECQNKIL
jgi:hypothetical protein